MSGDPEQEYFSDGITDDTITQLLRFKRLRVVARNSRFQFKGRCVDVRQAGDRVRITAQLIDAHTGHHLWADRYDRNLKDIFALQDEITMKILTALRVKLTGGEQARVYDRGTENLDCCMKVLEGSSYFFA